MWDHSHKYYAQILCPKLGFIKYLMEIGCTYFQ